QPFEQGRTLREGPDKEPRLPVPPSSITTALRWQWSQTWQGAQGARDFRASMQPWKPASRRTRPRKPRPRGPGRYRTRGLLECPEPFGAENPALTCFAERLAHSQPTTPRGRKTRT